MEHDNLNGPCSCGAWHATFDISEQIRPQLYSACYRAYEWAEKGAYTAGGNYWMTMFVDKLEEFLIPLIKENVKKGS